MRGKVRYFKTYKVVQTVSCWETNDRVKRPFVLARMWLKVEERGGILDLGTGVPCCLEAATCRITQMGSLTPQKFLSNSPGGSKGFKSISSWPEDGHLFLCFHRVFLLHVPDIPVVGSGPWPL